MDDEWYRFGRDLLRLGTRIFENRFVGFFLV
jgi:hypothetical protein